MSLKWRWITLAALANFCALALFENASAVDNSAPNATDDNFREVAWDEYAPQVTRSLYDIVSDKFEMSRTHFLGMADGSISISTINNNSGIISLVFQNLQPRGYSQTAEIEIPITGTEIEIIGLFATNSGNNIISWVSDGRNIHFVEIGSGLSEVVSTRSIALSGQPDLVQYNDRNFGIFYGSEGQVKFFSYDFGSGVSTSHINIGSFQSGSNGAGDPIAAEIPGRGFVIAWESVRDYMNYVTIQVAQIDYLGNTIQDQYSFYSPPDRDTNIWNIFGLNGGAFIINYDGPMNTFELVREDGSRSRLRSSNFGNFVGKYGDDVYYIYDHNSIQFFDREGNSLTEVLLIQGRGSSVYDQATYSFPGGIFLIGQESLDWVPRLGIWVDSATRLDVLNNDSDSDGDQISITAINGSSDFNARVPFSVGQTSDGQIILPTGAIVSRSGQSLIYDPREASFAIALADGVAGSDNFSYTISDGALTDSANVTVNLIGVNDPPQADTDAIIVGEDDLPIADLTATVLAGDTDPDTGETARLIISGFDAARTRGLVNLSAGNLSYSPNGAFENLALGQSATDSFDYTVTDPGGLSALGAVSVTVNGANDAPIASTDALIFAEEEAERDITATLLANDTDPDAGETAQLAIKAVDTTLTLGRVTLTGNVVSYDPNGAFNALSQGQSATDRFDYTISDPHGATATATAEVRINGFNGYVLRVTRTGLGAGTVTSAPIGLNCGGGGACEAFFTQNSQVSLSRFVAPESRFVSWGGACEEAGSGACVLTMTSDRTVSARFELENPPEGRIVAATLPGARSGFLAGGDITVFMSVLSRATTPAQACRITAPDNPPFTLSYRQVNSQNEVIGEINPLFDLPNGGGINFVIALTPTRTTDQSGYVFLPRIACENTNLSPIEGVNSVLVSIGAAPVPDILSIGSTPSGDGVVRIPATGNRISFLSAAAVNIGSGDGSAGAGEATVTASVDTGAASLPVTLEVCETASTGGCITPRGETQVSTVFAQNVAKFFAVFVRANGDSTVPFDPANARVYLRFADASGTIRSATSAAISAPAPASDQPEAASLTGRWSVLVRQESGEWPSLHRASLYVLGDGTAILDDGESVRSLVLERIVSEAEITRFDLAGREATTHASSIRSGDALDDQPGALWGVRDERSEFTDGWESLAGQYGDEIVVAANGSISGRFNGCIVSGAPVSGTHQNDLPSLSIELMRCDQSGTIRAVFDTPINDNEPALIIVSESFGSRLLRR